MTAPAGALADGGGASPDEGTIVNPPIIKPKPKPKTGGGSSPGQTAPHHSKPKPKIKPKPKPTVRPKPKPKVRPKPKPKVHPKPKPHTKPDPTPPPDTSGVFPVRGAHDFGGADSRFGAQRTGHIHQGQDISADEGTPIASPKSGSVLWRGNQPGGAGYYLVIHGNDGRDYVFMHLKMGSLKVKIDDTVRAGEHIAQVGNTGHSSGPHLHFEIWIGGWQSGGHPIDPLPTLRVWDTQARR